MKKAKRRSERVKKVSTKSSGKAQASKGAVSSGISQAQMQVIDAAKAVVAHLRWALREKIWELDHLHESEHALMSAVDNLRPRASTVKNVPRGRLGEIGAKSN